MDTSSGGIKERTARKHQEMVARETQILEVAGELLQELGYFGLTMERISERVPWSKPTVYQHFSSKEDVVLALAREQMEERNMWYARAAAFSGRPRERMLACGVVSGRVYAAHMRDVELTLFTHWLRKNASREQQLRMLDVDMVGHGILKGIIDDAVSGGDLVLPASMRSENVEFALWALSYGGHMICNANLPFEALEDLEYRKLPGTLAWAGDAFMDGIGWQPLSNEWDYGDTESRIRAALFEDDALGV